MDDVGEGDDDVGDTDSEDATVMVEVVDALPPSDAVCELDDGASEVDDSKCSEPFLASTILKDRIKARMKE